MEAEMRKVYVPLKQSEIDDLVVLARDQRRRPQDQAALWIAERLRAERIAEPNQTARENAAVV
jgi:hypothetical protein